jgi:hypothetical protein
LKSSSEPVIGITQDKNGNTELKYGNQMARLWKDTDNVYYIKPPLKAVPTVLSSESTIKDQLPHMTRDQILALEKSIDIRIDELQVAIKNTIKLMEGRLYCDDKVLSMSLLKYKKELQSLSRQLVEITIKKHS